MGCLKLPYQPRGTGREKKLFLAGEALEKNGKALKICLKGYEYHLKDHLGNVRTTFAVRDDDYPTGFETVENPYFDNYDQITRLSNLMKKSGSYSHRLTGGGTDIVGLMKTLYVSKGDKVSAEVYGKYLDAQFTDEEINGTALINALVSMLGGGTLSGEGTVVENSLNTDFLSAAMADDSEETSPKAYLNYILLDKNFNYLNSGFDRLSESAADPGDGTGTHQRLSFEEILIEEDGYLMVFLSNESDQSVEVFWDDFRVDHHYNAVLQADDYYPFGLTFNSYQRSYSKANNYKYQGKEEVPEMGGGTYDFHARMYDATLGKTFQMDPMAEKFYGYSPYSWVMNNPLIMIDPTGMVAAPIYDTEGNFLGTDDEGLQGAGIVMEKENFSQGMSHAEAKKKNLGAEGLKDEEALEKVGRHYSELPSRPDYDGVLTFKEVTKWSNQGSGEPLFVDGSKINLDNTSVEDVKDAQKNNNGYIDYFIKGGKNEIGVIYGNIKLTLENENTGDVKLGNNGLLDIHDFKNPAFKTINDMLYPGKPKDFKIYCAPCDNRVKTN